MLKDLIGSRDLAWRLTLRDISAQYRQSVFGVFWAFVPALLSAFLFIVLQRKNVVNIGDTGMPYPLFVLVGTVLWQMFAEAVMAPIKVVSAAKAVLAKASFPREALVLSAFYQTMFGCVVKSVLLVGVLVYFGVALRPIAVVAIVPMVLLVWLGVAIGLILTPFGMLIPDVTQMVTLGLQLAFFLTPVVYPAPVTFPYSLLANWNPVSPYLLASRSLLVLHTSGGYGVGMALVTVALIGLTFAGWLVYRVSMPIIIERISA